MFFRELFHLRPFISLPKLQLIRKMLSIKNIVCLYEKAKISCNKNKFFFGGNILVGVWAERRSNRKHVGLEEEKRIGRRKSLLPFNSSNYDDVWRVSRHLPLVIEM